MFQSLQYPEFCGSQLVAGKLQFRTNHRFEHQLRSSRVPTRPEADVLKQAGAKLHEKYSTSGGAKPAARFLPAQPDLLYTESIWFSTLQLLGGTHASIGSDHRSCLGGFTFRVREG